MNPSGLVSIWHSHKDSSDTAVKVFAEWAIAAACLKLNLDFCVDEATLRRDKAAAWLEDASEEQMRSALAMDLTLPEEADEDYPVESEDILDLDSDLLIPFDEADLDIPDLSQWESQYDH